MTTYERCTSSVPCVSLPMRAVPVYLQCKLIILRCTLQLGITRHFTRHLARNMLFGARVFPTPAKLRFAGQDLWTGFVCETGWL